MSLCTQPPVIRPSKHFLEKRWQVREIDRTVVHVSHGGLPFLLFDSITLMVLSFNSATFKVFKIIISVTIFDVRCTTHLYSHVCISLVKFCRRHGYPTVNCVRAITRHALKFPLSSRKGMIEGISRREV